MKRIKAFFVFCIGALLGIILAVMFPIVWLMSRVFKIPYIIFRGLEIFTAVFWKAVVDGYRAARAKKELIKSLTKVLGEVKHGRPS